MSAATTAPDREVFSIDWLAALPEEATQTGPAGNVYRLQLEAQRARHAYESAIYWVEEQMREQQRPGAIGTLNNPLDHIVVLEAQAKMEAAEKVMREAQEEIGGIVFCVATDNLEKISSKLATLNRRAAKLGTDEITLTRTDETVLLDYAYEQGYDGIASHDTFEHAYCILNGPTPKIEGFEFLASIETTPAGNLVKKIPPVRFQMRHNLSDEAAAKAIEDIDLSRFRDTGNICEHCNTHRERLDTFVVYNHETGETKQVGRNCLRDYMGTNNPEAMLKALEQYFEFMRSMNAPGVERVIPMDEYLAHCAVVIEQAGGKYESTKYSTGTAGYAQGNYWDMVNKATNKNGQPTYTVPEERHYQKAQAIKHWALNDWDDENSDFAINVRTSLRNVAVPRRGYGITAAVYAAYERAMTRKVETQQKAERSFVGEVGEKITFTAKLIRIIEIADRYSYDNSTKPLYVFQDEQGNEIKWYSSRWVIDNGSAKIDAVTFKVTGTVKKHEEHERFGKSTVIVRAKLEEI